MKKHLLTAIFIALCVSAFAQRPSTDETAVRLGVQAWLSARSSETGRFDFSKFKALYRPDLEFTDATTGKVADVRGLSAYTARLQALTERVQNYAAVPANDLHVSMNGKSATTSFTFRSEGYYKDGNPVTCAGRVDLTWERHDGFWQIAREETTPLAIPSKIATAK